MNQSGESRFGPENMNSYSASKLKKKIAFSMNCKFLILKQRKKKGKDLIRIFCVVIQRMPFSCISTRPF